MADSSDRNNPMDPFRMWREWYQKNERQWNDQISQMMGDERFSEGTGRMFQEALQMHRMFTESMGQFLANLNLPARSDILALGDRIGALEDAVAGAQVEIRQLRKALSEQGSGPENAERPRPSRTRKPQAD